MPTFEEIDTPRTASRNDASVSDHKNSRANNSLAPSAPHRSEVIEYSPNRQGHSTSNRAAILRRAHRLTRTKKYTQKINTGMINPFSDTMMSMGDGDLKTFFVERVKGIFGSLGKLIRKLFPDRKKKPSQRNDGPPGRRRRSRRRGGRNPNQKQNNGQGKDRWNKERQNRNRKNGPKNTGAGQKRKVASKGNSPSDSPNKSNRPKPRSNSNPNAANPNRNRRRRNRPAPGPRASNSPSKD